MIRKVALRIGVPALLAFMAWNAYLAVNHLNRMQKISALTLESYAIQADLSGVLKDLTDMETGQRGYLLTAGPAYLQPYNDAQGRIATDFAGLRAALANRAKAEQLLEPQLESLAKSKQGEMERSISLRQQGYRHRAFKLVDTNEGLEYMDRARELLFSLAVAEAARFATLEKDRNTNLSKFLVQTVLANLCLVLLT